MFPAWTVRRNKATTLSKYVVTDLLKKQMNFNGLVFTDALNMKGVSIYLKPGEVDLQALLAGNDVLLYSQDVPKAKA
jgi:beta-N-acetylhexosaminidase